MTLVDQVRAMTNGVKMPELPAQAVAAPDKLPVPPRRLIAYAGAEVKPAFKAVPAGTIVDGINCTGMTEDPKKAGVPVYLQAQNRKVLTPEQRAAMDAKVAANRPKSALDGDKPAGALDISAAKTKMQIKAEQKAARAAANAVVKANVKAARAASKAAKASAPKKPKRDPDAPTIGGVANAAILAGKSNEEALAAVMKAFPKCKSNLSCISWYRGKLRETGQLKGAAADRSPPATGKPKAKPAAAKSARVKVATKKKAPAKRPTKKAGKKH